MRRRRVQRFFRDGRGSSPLIRGDRLPARFATLTATAAAAKTAATRTRSHRLRFVDGEAAATELVLVELRDGALCALGIRHLDECKSARLAGGAIADDVDGVHLTSVSEQGLEIRFGGFVREIADVELRVHGRLLHFSMHWI